MISAIFTAIFLSFFASAILLNYKVGKILNLSLASIYTLGAYLLLATQSLIFAAPVSLIFGILIGMMVSRTTETLSVGEGTIVSLGFAVGIEELLRILFRSSYYQILETGYVSLFDEVVDVHELCSSILLVALLTIFAILIKSPKGLEIRFVEEDRELAEIYGVNTGRIRDAAIAISSGFVCLTGSLLAPTQALHPAMGWSVIVVGTIIAGLAITTSGFRKYLLTFPVALLYILLQGWFS